MLQLRVQSNIRLTGSSRTSQGRAEGHGSAGEPMIACLVVGSTAPLMIRCHIRGVLIRRVRAVINYSIRVFSRAGDRSSTTQADRAHRKCDL